MGVDIDLVDDSAVLAIVDASDGIPRQALGILERAISGDSFTAESVREFAVAYRDEQKQIFDLVNFLAMMPEKRRKRWNEGVTLVRSINQDPEGMRQVILKMFLDKMVLCDPTDLETAEDYGRIIKVFSRTAFYGGKSAIASMVVETIFDKTKE